MSADQYEAVFFWENGRIAREMLYSEFEAILDSFVPLPEYAGKEVNATYVRISPQLKVTASVYFLIGFDGGGNADPKWNVPLVQFAEEGDTGPNLGAGPIRLACKSQCPVTWHAQNLWDPNMSADPNDFVMLRDVVKRNKLHFKEIPLEDDELINAPPEPQPEATPQPVAPGAGQPIYLNEELSDADKTLAASLVQFLRKKLDEENTSEREDMAKKQRLLLAAQKTQFEDEITKLEEDHSEVLRQTQEKLQQYHNELSEKSKLSEKLKSELEEQSAAVSSAQKLFEQKLAQNQKVGSSEVEALKENMASEMKRKVEALAKEYSEQLAAKEMELAYHNDEISGLKEEVDQLHSERAVLISQGGDQFLNRLRDNDVSFVVYHAGAGHINIDLDSIGAYLENPIGYAAQSCKVTEEDYKAWLVHTESPVCQSYSETKGDICGKKLKAVMSPSLFVSGRSDRCPLHWSFAEETGETQSASADS